MFGVRQSVLLVFVLICLSNLGRGQGNDAANKLSGTILDAQKKPLPYATVALLREDSTVAGGDLTKDDGSFSIDFAGRGSYTVRISGIGFATKTINNISFTTESRIKNLGTITVNSTAQTLKEVNVIGERPLMEMSVDKKVFNVEKNITTAGGSASDVLQNVPSVSVDVDGSVSLRGKSNVTVLIDGKPATLLGGDVASALQSLPAASVQSVEVITNPSSKYDAQGMTGILNIITKRDKKFGFNGSVSAGAGTRDKYNGSLNLNLKNERWNVFLNSSFRQNRNYHHITTERINFNNPATYNVYEDNIRQFQGWFNSAGAEYVFDERNSVTLTQNLNLMRWGGKGVSTYDVYTSPEKMESTQRRSFYRIGGPVSSSTSLDYKHKFKIPKQELTANITAAKSWSFFTNEYETSTFFSDVSLKTPTVIQKAPGDGVNQSLNAQVDFTTPFLTKEGKLEAGLKTQLFGYESHNNPTIDSGTGETRDYLLLNIYNYTQQTHAAYVSYSNQRGRWSYQGGLRLENAVYEGTVNSFSPITYSNNFLNLFPTAFASYKLPREQSLYLNYSRRTHRPHFMQLIPYLDLSNPQDTSTGNPNLTPEFTHNTEFSYNRQFKKGHNMIVSTYYQYTENMIERYRRFYPDGTTFTQPQNLNIGKTYGLEITGRAQLLRVWDATVNLNFFRNEIVGVNIDPVLNNSGNSWFTKINSNIKLPEGFSVQMNGNYEAPKVAAQGRLEEVYWIDLALRKNMFNNKATLVLNVSDIFNSRKYTTIYEYPSYVQTVYRDRETRIGNISFTYRFGRSETDNKPNGSRHGGNGKRKDRQQNNEKDKERQNLKTDENGNDQGG